MLIVFQDIFNTLVYGDKTSTAAVRQAQSNSPVKSVTSPDMRCNVDPYHATETVTVSANDTIGFKLSAAIFHQGPAAIYLVERNLPPRQLHRHRPDRTHYYYPRKHPFRTGSLIYLDDCHCAYSSPQYLVRAEQIGLHNPPPEYYIGCAQVKIVNGGNGNPDKVSIPGHIDPKDPGVTANIYQYPPLENYTVPGPAVWRG
ncbi:hypothetical protein C0995_001149 [Termitomyces sp. Mi166|nr:hypothetical protein C0995_001149 [Termitomyces sp. Mi166\